ncbi:MAG: hypothetical protein ABSG43_13545 [Solirubrobacteraceae bacterium]
MLGEHEQRFARIVGDYLERPGGDYGELLQHGYVSSPEGVDPEVWRSEIRAQARLDKIRVLTSRDGEGAIAALHRAVGDREVRAELERVHVLRQLATIARALGHEPGHWLRSDQESVCFCERCDARLYVRTGPAPVSDGEALSEPCPTQSCAPPAA